MTDLPHPPLAAKAAPQARRRTQPKARSASAASTLQAAAPGGEMAHAAASPTLHYTVRACALGQVLVAGTAQGIGAVLLGDSRTALVDDLAQRYPHYTLATGDATLHGWSDAVLHRLAPLQAGGAAVVPPALPLLPLSGTPFQRAVWQALQAIPAGQTRTYTQLAQAMGQPRAVRAVASACGANPLAVLVPCHRVLRSDGGLGGYRWGEARKRQLLQAEGALPPAAA